jgi:hypothetical protein
VGFRGGRRESAIIIRFHIGSTTVGMMIQKILGDVNVRFHIGLTMVVMMIWKIPGCCDKTPEMIARTMRRERWRNTVASEAVDEP